ncbi:MAG: hypothetical protein IJF07_00690 [Lachnospiraceae bacterium]|nr:hypothetical protein [Lachnospiraceae bacterium]
MNRFESSTTHHGKRLLLFLPLGAFIILFFLFIQGIHTVNDTTLAKQKEGLETALSRSITQCYAVEGVYPPSLNYLKEHYGLTYDEATFLVDYQYYGGNLLPEVTVLYKQIPSSPKP